jgi:hypothetical protein
MAVEELRADESGRDEIADSETELRGLEPGVDGEVIHSLVQNAYDELTPAKVHTYLPILVVREVRQILRDRRAA